MVQLIIIEEDIFAEYLKAGKYTILHVYIYRNLFVPEDFLPEEFVCVLTPSHPRSRFDTIDPDERARRFWTIDPDEEELAKCNR